MQNADIAICKNNSSKILIELIRPLSKKSFTWNFLQKGGGLHHICYSGASLERINVIQNKYKMMEIRGPLKSAIFSRDVIFLMTREKQIIEYLL